MGKAVNELVDIIRDIIQEEVNKKDEVVLCQIKDKKDDFHYDVILTSDPDSVVHNITNATKFDFNTGDYVYVYKIKNQLANSFIFSKIIPYASQRVPEGSTIIEQILSGILGYVDEEGIEAIVVGGSDGSTNYVSLGYTGA